MNKKNIRRIIFYVLILLFICSLVELTDAQSEPNDSLFKKIILNETKKYPEMELQDIYKLIYQSARGSEHAVSDTAAVLKWIDKEITNLKWDFENSLIDTIAPGGKIVRINLRPYLKAGLNPQTLAYVFIKTATEFKSEKGTLEKNITCVLKMIKSKEININLTEAEEYFDSLKRKGYPAVHHSNKYKEKYSPAYRVIAGEYIPKLKKNKN